MAFLGLPDLLTLGDSIDISDSLFESSHFLLLEGADSDCDLPDNEHPVDLIKFLESSDGDFDEHLHENNRCTDGCTSCSTSNNSVVSTRQDPFMGSLFEQFEHNTSESPLLANPVAHQSGSEEVVQQQIQDIKPFSAWNTPKREPEEEPDIKQFSAWNTPKTEPEEEPDFMTTKTWFTTFNEEEDASNLNFPDTPSSVPSATNTGDDSDVDIETITDAPRSSHSWDNISPDSSPGLIPSASHAPFKMLYKSSGLLAKSSTSQNTLRASGSTLLAGTSSRQTTIKRKLSKDRKLTCQSHTVYQNVLCNSNSVNFHDYAMSPGAMNTMSTETGRPTVLSKRIYKRHSLDNPGKEKQHHHNQLERNRRQKLADLFVDLRDEVPKIASQAKASKVLILKEATLYIHELQKWNNRQEDDISRERRRKELLKSKLRHLQAQISHQCVK